MMSKQEPVVIERIFNASLAQVWKAITDKDEMKKWYFLLKEFTPIVGFEFQFAGGQERGEQYVHICKITEVVEHKRLTYSWRYKSYEGNSYVTFELFPEKSGTRLKLTHEGLETFPEDKPELAKENFVGGWTYIIGTNLKNYFN